ncbi:MAG: hypothetical protein HYR51_05070 [Candidatus Rokubacteria bacterium]|nr:hypothetical protein [Candidatus Rokubacteria bacterium]
MKWILAVVIAAAWAYVLVYGTGAAEASLLRGRVLVAGFLGGWALAFTRPLLVFLLIPFATVVWLRTSGRGSHDPRWSWLPPALFLTGFSLTFAVAISGAPDPVARAIYRAHGVSEVALGVVLALWGALVAVRVPAVVEARSGWLAAGLGVATGLLFYHELDPSYDSVFFATGNAVASSHAPLTVAVFSTALSVLYFAAAVPAARWRFPAGRTLAGAGTVLVGVAVAGGWLAWVSAMVLR